MNSAAQLSASGLHVAEHTGDRAVSAEHVPELLCAEMRQLIETDERDLRALPVVDRFFVFEVSEGNARTRWKGPA